MLFTILKSVIVCLGLNTVSLGSPASIFTEHTTIDKALDNPKLLSTEGQSIELIRIRNLDGPPKKAKIFFQGALHGNEILTTEFLRWLTQQIQDKQSSFSKLLTIANIDIVPVGNPDRYGKSRFNSLGVNLNRNFRAFWGTSREKFGAAPLSERETKALNALFSKERYQIAIDIHGYVNWIVTPSLPVNEIIDPQSQRAYQTWQKIVSSQIGSLSPLAQYRQKTALGLGDGGAFEDWAFWDYGSFAACLEMASPKRFRISEQKTIDSFKVYEEFLFNVSLRGLAARGVLDGTNKNHLIVAPKQATSKNPAFVHH